MSSCSSEPRSVDNGQKHPVSGWLGVCGPSDGRVSVVAVPLRLQPDNTPDPFRRIPADHQVIQRVTRYCVGIPYRCPRP